jgi:hypothetical protein
VFLDTDNMLRFMDEALVCRACQNKMILKAGVNWRTIEGNWIVTIEDMIGEGGYLPHLDNACIRCLEGISVVSRFLPERVEPDPGPALSAQRHRIRLQKILRSRA